MFSCSTVDILLNFMNFSLDDFWVKFGFAAVTQCNTKFAEETIVTFTDEVP